MELIDDFNFPVKIKIKHQVKQWNTIFPYFGLQIIVSTFKVVWFFLKYQL